MPVHIALLRGVNVGGKNRLPMTVLSEMFVRAGCGDVRTYIQSGNVVFSAPAKDAKGIGLTVSKALKAKLGLSVPVVIRSDGELARAIKANPFNKKGAKEDALHIGFLADVPAANDVNRLDPHRSPPDQFAVVGREIYLHCPNGMGKTKLTNAWFDATLKTVSTMRNWRTVRTLMAMAEGKEPGKPVKG